MSDWEELIIVCDNCGHIIHVKKAELDNHTRKTIMEKGMTYGDIYAKCHETIRHDPVIDYRPNEEMYVDDLKDKVGIRLWFKNGDSAIYFPSGK